MAIPIEMPKLSDTMEEGVVVAWLAEEGQKVAAGDVIAQVETDKATMDLEIYDDGVLLKRVIGEGDAVSIGGLIAVLGEEGEDISSLLAEYSPGNNGSTEKSEDTPEETPEETLPDRSDSIKVSVEAQPSTSRIKASPLARRLASERGIDMKMVRGSGPEGRIVKRDIESFVPESSQGSPPHVGKSVQSDRPVGSDAYSSLPLSQMRKAIARRLAESKFTAPHFYLTADIDMQKAVAARIQLNELALDREQQKVSFNDLVTKSCALALRENKWVNASYLDD